ncbi:MAG TPA: GDSL-type esterase/lipase family protein [Pontibacter sp.]
MFYIACKILIMTVCASKWLVPFCLLLFYGIATIAQPARIMCLGNSITQSDAANYSYRYNLWKKLLDANLDVDFVGSHAVNKNGNPNWPAYKGRNFDSDNEGHWGWTADQILYGNTSEPANGKLNEWLTGYTPDILLLHLGTNDIFQGHPLDGTLDELREVVKQVRARNPNVVILLAQLIPADPARVSSNTAENIRRFNEKIPGLVEELDQVLSPVVLVDQYTGFNAKEGVDTWDGVHPNAAGEEKMAQRWFTALLPFFTPMPVTLTGFSATITPSREVRLNWETASEQNNAYFEIQRSYHNTAQFITIGTVKGAGTTNVARTYSYLDDTVPTIDLYYRLKQVDEDGTSTYSDIVHLEARPITTSLQVYPTVATQEHLTLTLHLQTPGVPAELTIYNVNGTHVKTLKGTTKPDGSLKEQLRISSLQGNGLYIVRAVAGGRVLQQKFIIDQ